MNIQRGQEIMRRTARKFLFLLLALVQYQAIAQKAPWEEYEKIVGRARQVSPLGPTLFGDSIQLQSGNLAFRVTDVELPGNNALNVSITRSFSTRTQGQDGAGNPPVDSPMGDWDIDLPNISGVFARSTGWINPVPGKSASRCSILNASEAAAPSVTQGGASFSGYEIWQGTKISLPGRGSHSMLFRAANTPQPSSGGAVWISSDWTIVKCLSSVQNDSGEGFIATDSNGITYRFDWMAVSVEPQLKKKPPSSPADQILNRGRYALYATHVEDRFGNWVNYTYTNAANQPIKLQSIQSSDGRQLTLSYSGSLVTQVTANSRVWTYSYNAAHSLTAVTLPDGSSWAISLPNFKNMLLWYYKGEPGEAWRNCQNPGDLHEVSYTGVITHPSGAVGTFTLLPERFVRNGIDYASNCAIGNPNDPNDDEAFYPMAWDSFAVQSKVISGPGLLNSSWTYSYNQGDSTEVTGPGEFARYTFGNQFQTDEGLLLKEERGASPGQILRTTEYVYDLGTSGKPYPSRIGSSGQIRGGDFGEEFIRPKKISEIRQQDVTFSRSVQAFDAFARPATTVLASTLPSSTARTELNEYSDNTNLWVIGQLKKVSVGSLTPQQIDYDASWALPLNSYAFGVLQRTDIWDTSSAVSTGQRGTLSNVLDGKGNNTKLSDWYRAVPRSIVRADGYGVSALVDDNGWVTQATDENGYITRYSYDLMGRLQVLTPPLGFASTSLRFEPVFTSEFDLAAGHWRMTMTKGDLVELSYLDALWRPVMTRSYDQSQEAATRAVAVKSFDIHGRPTFQSYLQRDIASVATPALGTHTQYDSLGRTTQTQVDSELGALTSVTEYLSAFQTRSTNPRGIVSTQGSGRWTIRTKPF